MTLIDAQDGYPKTQIVMDNGAAPDDIAQWTKRRLGKVGESSAGEF
jgi:hypothetical protein